MKTETRRWAGILSAAVGTLLSVVIAPQSRAEDGITNIISGSTVTNIGTYNVGSNGSFNALVLTNAGVLRVTGDGTIGNSAISSNNYAIVTGAGSVWSNSAYLYVGYTGSFNQLAIVNGGKTYSTYGNVGYSAGSISNAVVVTGAGSLWSNSSSISVGYYGSFNQLTISNSGTVYSGGSGWLGVDPSANGNKVTITGTGSVWSASSFFAGYSSLNQLNVINGGKLYNSKGMIGVSAGANSNVALVSGAGSVWSNSMDFTVGWGGASNQLIIADGGTVYSAGGYIGFAGGNSNTVTVTGAGSVWKNTVELYVGDGGSLNQLAITGGGSVYNSGNYSYIGFTGASKSNAVTVADAGSVWSNSNLIVGANGSFNQLTITNGAAVYSVVGYIGTNSSANANIVTVAGAGSVWSNSSELYVGWWGDGNQLIIANSGRVYDTTANIGADGPNNSVTVTGVGSVWSNSANLYIGQGGLRNSLTITNGGTVYSANGYICDRGGASGYENVVLVSGVGSAWNNSSNLYVGGIGGSYNQLTISYSGTVSSTTGYIGFGYGAGNNSVLVTGAGSVWSNSGTLFVGYIGTYNQLTISSGGKVYSTTGYIGNSMFFDLQVCNTAVVTGVGSLWTNSGDLFLGATGGFNQLTISNGGMVVNANGYIGYDIFGSYNNALVTGTNSIWYNTNNLYVGFNGHDNLLTISNGGTVANANGYIGYNASYDPWGTNNRVIVSGAGSVWSNAGSVYVGFAATNNSLAITNGGMVVSQNGAVGNASGANINFALVAGAGSLWTNSGDLYVGATGSFNQLIISNAGMVVNANAYIGADNNAKTNSALITGSASLWQNNGNLLVGSNGSSSRLTVSNGGKVTAANLIVGATATSTGNIVTVSGGNLYVTNAAQNGSLDIRRGTLAINTGTVVVNRLYLTNNASSVMTFNAGLLQSGGSTVSNGVAFTVGDGVQSATLDLLGGTHRFANGLMLSTNSSLIGSGGIFGSATNFGIIAPGHSVGTINITGDLTLADSSWLDMELAGPGTNDVLDISGLLKAGGGLKLTLTNGYTGNIGDTFDLFNFGSVSGTFAQTNLPTLVAGMEWNTSKLYTLGEIKIVPEPGTGALLALGLAAFASRRVKSSKLRAKKSENS
ncbi:MAG: PEP-CTERM sorting domain-containing protein [Verrucomicrobia bacterium]|nr:PEP-CTERM sorting domain-containing protein [Verrucomicrobiota bacterium]